ncbi:MAG: FtsX-like permease family protein [Gammaproteobacteria bacterium]|nr:FtsX-like permease family protein [Pseudomonadales bacterium]MCP5348485.1 FtsX-like permease family protein [Pseudomonadales bacterium]
MEIGPIFRAMWRNRIGVALIALQIAFTMTVVVNAIYIINERSRLMARPSGLDEANLFYLRSVGFQEGFDEESTIVEDRILLQATPGIIDMTVMNAIPLSGSGSSTGVRVNPDANGPSTYTALYRVDEHAIDTMGLELIAGENFTTAEVRQLGRLDSGSTAPIIITEALAEALFTGGAAEALGNTLYWQVDIPMQIIGVVKQLQAPWPTFASIENSMLIPNNILDGQSLYLVRTEPGQVNTMMLRVEELLADSNPARIIMNVKSLEETRADSYRIDSSMARILLVVIVILVFITSMGVVGLAVFGINRRRRQIGTRRALGATQGQIIRYFLVENLIISGIGVTLGAVLTLGFNIFLVQTFNMPRIEWYYTPLGMLALVLVGLLAVLGPSRGAARIPPAIATRTV